MADNPMKAIRIEKLTLNVGAGKNPAKLEKSMKLLKEITGVEPVKTFTQKRIPSWGLRPGLPIGCKLTLRKGAAVELLPRLLKAKENRLREKQFDDGGNIAFGIPEYVDVPGVKYDPEIGILGFEVCVTLERVGYRVKRRRIGRTQIPPAHKITKDEAIAFMKETYQTAVGDEQ